MLSRLLKIYTVILERNLTYYHNTMIEKGFDPYNSRDSWEPERPTPDTVQGFDENADYLAEIRKEEERKKKLKELEEKEQHRVQQQRKL